MRDAEVFKKICFTISHACSRGKSPRQKFVLVTCAVDID